MMLSSENAFGALRELTGGNSATEWKAADAPAIERLRSAWLAPMGRSPLELAVLVRQALQFESGRREGGAPNLPVAAEGPMRGFAKWASLGLRDEPFGSGRLVSAEPWRPPWGVDIPREGLEAYAVAERTKPAASGLPCAGDPFLAAVGHTTYQSVGQRAAVRAALTTPAGGTLAVSLATGEGKSLIFQLAARIGFAGDETPAGVVVVVVPTVALAVDHENAAFAKGFDGPIAYRGGDEVSNAILKSRLEAGGQSLCVASPEAICGPLRQLLGELAERGRLGALVLDEAHLVDNWGTGFRTEFQSLAGVRQEWIGRAPPGCAPRTLLLSATLTENSVATLKSLFSGPGPFERLTALRLRSEPDYWAVACADDLERTKRVLEALHHLPRPAILYVTRVDQADDWYVQLREAGFQTVKKVHGKTPNPERERVLLGWRRGEVDLVVATSAFGLGIDFPHVRSVIHACIPESLDRFYQEVGRSGRDGRSCISVVLHTLGDLGVARSISRALVISIKRGLQRWESMFSRRKPGEVRDTYLLPLDVAPSHEPEDIDMEGERNSDWNSRVLALMARAGLIRLLGGRLDLRAPGPHEQVLILNHEHLDPETWARHVDPLRRDLAKANINSLKLMRDHLRAVACPAPSFLSLYDARDEAHACSRCATCRADPMARRPEQPRLEPSPPWAAPRPLGGRLTHLLGSDCRLVIWYERQAVDLRFRRRFGRLLRTARLEGLTNVAFVGEATALAEEAYDVGRNLPFFFTQVSRLPQRRLPPGGELVVLGRGAQLESLDLAPPQHPDAQILMLPHDLPDPNRPGLPLRLSYGGRSISFDIFFESLAR